VLHQTIYDKPNVYHGNPANALVSHISQDKGKQIDRLNAYWLGGLATARAGDNILNENGELRKVLSGDWTQNCNSKNVDTTKFVNMMQVVKAGKQIDWICPFCGGKVERLEQEGGKTVIGCTSCDMRIQIEN